MPERAGLEVGHLETSLPSVRCVASDQRLLREPKQVFFEERWRMTKRAPTAIGLVIGLLGLSATAQTLPAFSSLDRDDNRVLSQAEFGAFGREIFAALDRDGDGNIEEDEFYRGIYEIWDVDNDGFLTLPEYDDGWSAWFDPLNYVAFNELDSDADDVLEKDEFQAGLADTRLYHRWTFDGALGEREFVTAIYNVYDADSDGFLTQDEFQAIGYDPA